ncbi:DUF6745 domain-containing protein [Verrucosispora sp. WMMD1129]|uniref:DUF6745 domain-containing protein n=1 Tax=Verrucosispora sp. WMMD1129 TaxID=3016093 RepID=UPI00249C2F28|nr:hypothetical protein [Verrucosispora sp. WMMD1129]WFE47821.1 hypothetical protein O7624_27540 [Verrucosispora sp. WMMD1129]
MTAPTRHDDAAPLSPAPRDLWRQAEVIRQEWLGYALSTEPADRPTTQRCLTAIYARAGRHQPRFVWADSPAAALPLIRQLPTLGQLLQRVRDPAPAGPPPPASDIATVASRLRAALGDGVQHTDPELSPVRRGRTREPWPDLPPQDALDRQVPLGVVLHRGVRNALHRSLIPGFTQPVRAGLPGGDRQTPVCWYSQQDAFWVGYYDALHRLGLAAYTAEASDQLRTWTDLARSGGWWWPGPDVCVVVERPAVIRTEPVPGSWYDEVRLRPDGVGYRDGWRPPPC